jgi:cold shock CspA family protein
MMLSLLITAGLLLAVGNIIVLVRHPSQRTKFRNMASRELEMRKAAHENDVSITDSVASADIQSVSQESSKSQLPDDFVEGKRDQSLKQQTDPYDFLHPVVERSEEEGAEEVIVEWFNQAKGYGFVRRRGSDKSVFIHQSVLRESGVLSLATNEVLRAIVKTDERGRLIVERLISDYE